MTGRYDMVSISEWLQRCLNSSLSIIDFVDGGRIFTTSPGVRREKKLREKIRKHVVSWDAPEKIDALRYNLRELGQLRSLIRKVREGRNIARDVIDNIVVYFGERTPNDRILGYEIFLEKHPNAERENEVVYGFVREIGRQLERERKNYFGKMEEAIRTVA